MTIVFCFATPYKCILSSYNGRHVQPDVGRRGREGQERGVGHATATGRLAIWCVIYRELCLGCGILLHPYVSANVVTILVTPVG